MNIPNNLDAYQPLHADEIRIIFRRGLRSRDLEPGMQVAIDADGTVYVYGWVDNSDAERMARQFGRITAETVEIRQMSLLFTRLPLPGRTPEAGAKWYSTVVNADVADSVPVTIVQAVTS
jgi:hypothetical protein